MPYIIRHPSNPTHNPPKAHKKEKISNGIKMCILSLTLSYSLFLQCPV